MTNATKKKQSIAMKKRWAALRVSQSTAPTPTAIAKAAEGRTEREQMIERATNALAQTIAKEIAAAPLFHITRCTVHVHHHIDR
jgi:hypothetical protein